MQEALDLSFDRLLMMMMMMMMMIRCQLLHVSAANCHHQAVYQQQNFAGPNAITATNKVASPQTGQTPDRTPTSQVQQQ